MELKKVAALRNIEGVWKILDVIHVKEFHNATKSIDVIGN